MDRRSDIWAFGCVLFEMLSGHKPFEGETTSDVLASVIKSEPDWNALSGTTPPSIQELIRRCLQKDPRQPLQAIGDARITIELTLTGDAGAGQQGGTSQSEAAEATSDSSVIITLTRRYRGKVIALGLLIAAFLIVTGYSLYLMLGPAGHVTGPSSLAANIQFTQLTSSVTAHEAAISPDGRYVAYVQQASGGQNLWLRRLATGSTDQIVPPAAINAYCCLEFTCDGNDIDNLQRLQSGSEGSSLYQVPVLGGLATKLLEHIDSAVGFSPDGKWIVYCSTTTGTMNLLKIPINGGSRSN